MIDQRGSGARLLTWFVIHTREFAESAGGVGATRRGTVRGALDLTVRIERTSAEAAYSPAHQSSDEMNPVS